MKKCIFIILMVWALPVHFGVLFTKSEQPKKLNKLRFTVSAYSPVDTPGSLTASGTPPRYGVVACPRRYALGTRFLIQGRAFLCTDRLSISRDHRIDIFFPSFKQASAWGLRRLSVQVLTPNPHSGERSISGAYHLPSG